MRTRDPVSVIEAAYAVELEQSAWLGGVARAAQAVSGASRGALALLYDATRDDWIAPVELASHELPESFISGIFRQEMAAAERRTMVQVYRSLGFAGLRGSPLSESTRLSYAKILDEHGMGDVLCMNAIDPTHRGCLVLVPVPHVRTSVRQVRLWRRVGAHVAAGVRLRRSLDELKATAQAPTERAEAILAPNGRVEHAVGPATAASARAKLQDGLLTMERARSRAVNSEEAVALWQALVDGRWSIVEHFERDGKRYYLAHKNDPALAADRALTLREQQIVAYAQLGYSNKLIAYSLGIAPSTVSTTLAAARRKLGHGAGPA
jgi:DNA-binding CsgD family transcriptional regulator